MTERPKHMLHLALAAALGAPALAMSPPARGGPPRVGWDPRRVFGGGRPPSERQRRDPMGLLLRGFPEIPCTAPMGYFWKRDISGKHHWRIYRLPPGESRVLLDEANDRLIIFSGWGYAKPTYRNRGRDR